MANDYIDVNEQVTSWGLVVDLYLCTILDSSSESRISIEKEEVQVGTRLYKGELLDRTIKHVTSMINIYKVNVDPIFLSD